MSGFTKQAIQASFLKLLDTYPLRDITVRMITEDCGINRKSFYFTIRIFPPALHPPPRHDRTPPPPHPHRCG